ncbi:MAG: sortase [Alphaproteobacteria bacterium]
MSRIRYALRWFIVGLSLAGIWQGGIAALAAGKAWLAPILVERAWLAAGDGPPRPPWPGADGRPAGLIEVPDRGIIRHVLSDASMRMLAFGPVAIKTDAARTYFGHNDTHFSFLRHLKKNDVVLVTGDDRVRRSYKVTDLRVAEEDAIRLPLDETDAEDRVVLITCYPFDASVSHSSQRYVVTAMAMQE